MRGVVMAGALILSGCGAEVSIGPEPGSKRQPEPPPEPQPAPAPYECGPMSLEQMGLDVPLCPVEPQLTLLDEGQSWEAARDEQAVRLVVTGDGRLQLPRVAADGTVDDDLSLSYGEEEGYRQARGVGVDANGHIWAALMYDDAALFDGQVLEPLGDPLTLSLARITPSGVVLGVDTIGITHNANHVGMLPMDDGMVVAGSFTSALTLAPTEAPETSDGFVAAFDSNGGLVWVRTLGTPLTDFAVSLTSGPDGTIYVVGSYALAHGDGQTPEAHAAAGGLLARLSPSGELLSLGKVEDPRIGDVADITVLADGTLVIVGSTKPPIGYNLVDAFIARLDVDGEVLWYRELGGERGGYALEDVEILSDGRIAMVMTLGTEPCGSFSEEGDPTAPIEPHSQPVLVLLDQTGAPSCATEWGNSAVTSSLIAFDGGFAITGSLYGPTFGDEPRSSRRRPFVARFE